MRTSTIAWAVLALFAISTLGLDDAEARKRRRKKRRRPAPTHQTADSSSSGQGPHLSRGGFFSAGGGLILYGTEIERPGIQGMVYYSLQDKVPGLLVGADLSLFYPRSETVGFAGSETEISLWLLTIDLNAHWIFYSMKEFEFYALGGLNFSHGRATTTVTSPAGSTENTASETNVGINLGGGMEYDAGFADIYGELKFVAVSDFDQLVIAGGLRWDL